jgi:primosomal protein N''
LLNTPEHMFQGELYVSLNWTHQPWRHRIEKNLFTSHNKNVNWMEKNNDKLKQINKEEEEWKGPKDNIEILFSNINSAW